MLFVILMENPAAAGYGREKVKEVHPPVGGLAAGVVLFVEFLEVLGLEVGVYLC